MELNRSNLNDPIVITDKKEKTFCEKYFDDMTPIALSIICGCIVIALVALWRLGPEILV